MKFLKITILFSLISILLTSCNVKEVEIGNIKSFNIVNINKEFITVDLAAKVKNPNNFSFTISKVNLDISFNGIDLGKIDKVEKVKIAKNSNEVQHLVFKINLKHIKEESMLFIPSLLSSRAKIKVTGYIKARKLLLSKKIKIDYSKTTKISKDLFK